MGETPWFFETPPGFRDWLRKNHATSIEVQFGFHKRSTGRPSITWPEAVAEAVCFGWIDGVRKRLDDDRYVIRFTPRKRGSRWSTVNIAMVEKLETAGKMTAAGRAAFAAREESNSKVYSYEQSAVGLDETRLKALQETRKAWSFFEAQPPSYRKKASWWVMSAKREETRDRRLRQLRDCSAAGRRLK